MLVIEDAADIRGLLVHILEDRYEVSTASDGDEGLAAVRRLRPAVVVLDLMLPRMHGFEVCRMIRADKDLAATKILIVSSKSYKHDIGTAVKETGADGYLVKPFKMPDFAKLVDLLAGGA